MSWGLRSGTIRAAVWAMLDAGKSLDEIVAKVRCSRKRVTDERWIWRDKDEVRRKVQAAAERRRREAACMPRGERRRIAEQRAKELAPLVGTRSFRQIAEERGLTRGTVAGRLWRHKQRERQRGARA